MPAMVASPSEEQNEPLGSAWVALVGPEVEENLSLRYLAASVENAGVPAELFPFNAPSDLALLLDALCEAPMPMLIAVSLSFQWRAIDMLSLVVALRERGYEGHITAGGHFGSFCCEAVLEEFPELDSVCRFEAEETLRELCVALRDNDSIDGIAGLAVQGRPFAQTIPRPPPVLASLAWPDRRGEPARCLGHAIAPMISSRGCYANCSFCCIATLHRHNGSSERHRLRAVNDVADEMAWLQRERGTEIFIFHDDNFFLPRHHDSLARVQALAGALEERGVTRFATVVKARPNDVTEPVFRAMRDRLSLIRLFLGVESSTHQGCKTLGRGVRAGVATESLGLLADIGIYTCFNMLVFDPDATVESLLDNLAFVEAHSEHPSNFGRVELYAGTPLLERMHREGRAVGDYVTWDYDQATPEMQRVFELTIDAFRERNFSGKAMANRLQSTRFDAEVAKWFHPDRFDPAWLEEAKDLSRVLAASSASGVRRVVEHVRSEGLERDDAFVVALAAELRACEDALDERASSLEQEIQSRVGAKCVHAPSRGIPVPRAAGATPQRLERVVCCATPGMGG